MTELTRRRTRALLFAVAIIVVSAVAVVAVVAVAVIGGRGAVTTSAGVEVGGCVVVRDRGNDAVSVDAVGCTGEGMTFYVAARSSSESACPSPEDGSARIAPDLRVAVGADALCLVPDLRQGRCYLLPADSGGSTARRAARYERKGCSTVAGAADSPIYEVTRRVDGVASLTCPDGEEPWGTQRPRPIAYCLTPTRAG